MTTAECSHDKLRDRSEVDSRDVSPLVRLLSQQPYSSVSLEWDISQAPLTPLTQRQPSSSSFLSSLTLNGSALPIHTCCCPSPRRGHTPAGATSSPSSHFHYYLFHQECPHRAPVCQGTFKSSQNWLVLAGQSCWFWFQKPVDPVCPSQGWRHLISVCCFFFLRSLAAFVFSSSASSVSHYCFHSSSHQLNSTEMPETASQPTQIGHLTSQNGHLLLQTLTTWTWTTDPSS